MKKLFILLYFLACVQGVQAQISKGSVVATGSFGFGMSSVKPKDDPAKEQTRSYNISPQLGLMISDNLEVGFLATLNKSKNEYHRKNPSTPDYTDIVNNDSETTQKEIGLYLRKYLFLTEKLAISARGEISYSVDETNNQYRSQYGDVTYIYRNTYKNADIEAIVRPGISYFISEKISLSATYIALGYMIKSSKSDSRQDGHDGELILNEHDEKTNRFDLRLASSVSFIGLSYFF